MNLKKLKIILSFLTIFALGACGDDACVRGDGTRECGAGNCVDADDWGYPKIKVSAEEKDLNIKGSTLNQYADAIDTGQVILDAGTPGNPDSGIPIVITIGQYDQWTSWFGGDINPVLADGNPDPDGFDGGRTVPDIECHYVLPSGKTSNPSTSTFASDLSPEILKVNKNSCPSLPITAANDPADDNYADCYTPCYFRNGMGLYIGLAPDNGNKSKSSDVVLTYHIPDAKAPDGRTKYTNIDVNSDGTITDAENTELRLAAQGKDGYLVNGPAAVELPGAQTGDRLYLKIVDRTYTDNTGGYTVKIKEGTRSSSPGPLETISGLFINPMKIVMNRIYNGIVESSDFINAVQAFLALYVVFYGYVFVIAGMENVKKEAMTRIFKITMLVVLISPGSYEFFYNHLFSAFVGGVQSIAALLMNPFGDYDPNNPWYSMDQVLAKFWSTETWSKIASTMFSNSLGMLFVITIFIAVGLFMVAVIKALITYLLAFAGIALLVIIFPVFLIFTLFTQTAKLMNEWLDQLFTYGIQQIVLLAGLGIFAAVIVMYLERTIGYHVCWNVWLPLHIGSIQIYDFKFWMPDISSTTAALWLDTDGDGVKELVTRYIDMPYLDMVYDKDQIAKLMSEKNFISIFDLLILISAVFLMFTFMQVVPQIASALKGGSQGESMNIFDGGAALGKSLMGAGGAILDNIRGAAEGARQGYANLTTNNEARWLGGKARRSGIAVANKAGSAASGTAKHVAGSAANYMRNTSVGKSISAGAASARESLNEFTRPLRDNMNAFRSDVNNVLSEVGLTESQSHEVKDLYVTTPFEVTPHIEMGANLGSQTLKGKGELDQRRKEILEAAKSVKTAAKSVSRSGVNVPANPESLKPQGVDGADKPVAPPKPPKPQKAGIGITESALVVPDIESRGMPIEAARELGAGFAERQGLAGDKRSQAETGKPEESPEWQRANEAWTKAAKLSARANETAIRRELHGVLGLAEGASSKDVKDAYRKLALAYKDTAFATNGDKQAVAEMAEINSAYKALTDDGAMAERVQDAKKEASLAERRARELDAIARAADGTPADRLTQIRNSANPDLLQIEDVAPVTSTEKSKEEIERELREKEQLRKEELRKEKELQEEEDRKKAAELKVQQEAERSKAEAARKAAQDKIAQHNAEEDEKQQKANEEYMRKQQEDRAAETRDKKKNDLNKERGEILRKINDLEIELKTASSINILRIKSSISALNEELRQIDSKIMELESNK